jgi:uncharacterized protein (TIGR02996 family)
VFEEYPDAAGFLAAIRAAPDDPTPRLVFSDWLEERGDLRAPWLRDNDIWAWMAPDVHDPVPALLAELQAEAWDRRDSATSLLLRLGPLAGDAVRRWIRDVEDRYHRGVEVVRAVPPTTLQSVADLGSILRTEEAWVERWLAIIDLGHYGSAAAPAVGELIDALEEDGYLDSDGAAREEICRTLARIGRPAAEAIPSLIRFARYASEVVSEALNQLIPLCSEALRADPVWSKLLCNFLLGQWDTHDPAAITARIFRLGRHAAEWVVPDLIEVLRSPNGDPHEIRCGVALTLMEIGEGARDAVPALRKVLEEYDLFVPTGGFAEAAHEAIRTALATLDPG